MLAVTHPIEKPTSAQLPWYTCDHVGHPRLANQTIYYSGEDAAKSISYFRFYKKNLRLYIIWELKLPDLALVEAGVISDILALVPMANITFLTCFELAKLVGAKMDKLFDHAGIEALTQKFANVSEEHHKARLGTIQDGSAKLKISPRPGQFTLIIRSGDLGYYIWCSNDKAAWLEPFNMEHLIQEKMKDPIGCSQAFLDDLAYGLLEQFKRKA